jgi:hypothetical protein
MKPIITILAAAALATDCSISTAQTTSPSTQDGAQATGNTSSNATTKPTEAPESLAAGTAVNAQLSKPIDSKKVNRGDAVEAHTTEAVRSDGKVVVQKGTKLVGHITRATAKSKGDADSTLAMQFDRMILKDGREMPVQVTIQALASSENAAVSGDELQPMTGMPSGAASGGRASANTVGGAASGAASTVPRTAGTAVSGVESASGQTVDAAGRAAAAVAPSGELRASSHGVIGLNGLSLNAAGANSTEGSLITSTGKNVHLDSGTRLLLVTQAPSSASVQQ